MTGKVIPLFKGNYEQAVRTQNPAFKASKGYPAVRDPAAENPVGLLQGAGEGDLRRLRQHYSRPFPFEDLTPGF